MACSRCGMSGHNIRTCHGHGYTPTPAPVTYGPPPVRRGTSGAAIALITLAGLFATTLGGCLLCVLAAPSPHPTSAAPEQRNAAQEPAMIIAASPTRAAAAPPPLPVPAAAPVRQPVKASTPAPAAGGGGRAKCCDGTVSPSCGCGGGRGCCSRHGGVCGCN